MIYFRLSRTDPEVRFYTLNSVDTPLEEINKVMAFIDKYFK